ncbi:hypothetical protein HY214_04940, partial [Candidatus Roizmanbacteria bacterium]|nr:hypothetical protein [Candidatus Roizmanbacteria bacterium]
MIKRLINRVAELKQAYFNWLVFLLAFFLPSQLGKHFFFPFSYVAGIRTDYLAPTLFLTDVLAAFLIVPLLLGRKSFFPRKITISVLLLLVGIIFSVAPLLSFYKEIKYLEVVLLGASLFSVLQRKKQRVFFFSLGLMFSAILELIVALLQFINKRSLQGVFYFFGERAFSLSTPGIAKASYHGIEFLRP